MPEDNTPISPVMPPVDVTTPDNSDSTFAIPASNNPAAMVAPAVNDMPVADAMPTEDVAVQDSSTVDAPVDEDISNDIVAEAAPADGTEIYPEVIGKIREAKNILVALSSDPSVDEMAAAIGLSLYLDKLGKHVTAIYSGVTPNALEFLKPEETFEPTADALQDFVIALDKEKADHLRYKIDGNFVKIYITPYKTRIAENDLEFSYGDFNVDLVLALDVANGIDLDDALREHGRIMHDAVIINISTSKPGKFGEIEWSDKTASSVSEMIAKLLYSVNSDVNIEKEEATAFLTGIVAATNRFSSASTTPETMQMASKLMKSGANQQLISQNITPDIENELFSISGSAARKNGDPTKLEIDHNVNGGGDNDNAQEVDAVITEKENTLLDDLKAAEASLAQAGVDTAAEPSQEPLRINSNDSVSEPTLETQTESAMEPQPEATAEPEPEIVKSEPGIEEPEFKTTEEPAVENNAYLEEPTEEHQNENAESSVDESPILEPGAEKVIQPSSDFANNIQGDDSSEKYGKMLEEALGDVEATNTQTEQNPAMMSAPEVPTTPEINGVPEMNYAVTNNEAILPPPPMPPVDVNSSIPPAQAPVDFSEASLPTVEPIMPAAPPVEPTLNSLGEQPVMQDQIYTSPTTDPGAFKIPGA